MSALETIREWVKTYPGHDILSEFSIDYTDQIPANGGIFPSGLTEVSRRRYITGDTMVENQYNFGIYYVFAKAPEDDVGALVNADWVMDFQEWVQEQSINGDCPQFGDKTLSIKAQNGTLYAAEAEGTATYMVQLSVNFNKFFKKR